MQNDDFLKSVQLTLDAMRRSKEFRGSSRLFRLLNLVVEHELSHPGQPLKAYAIATLALDRRADFDPSTDSIVRVEMARLRTALKLFYAERPDVPIKIDIPKGTHKPTLTTIEESETESSPTPVRSSRSFMAMITRDRWQYLTLAFCLLGIVVLTKASRPPLPEWHPPVILVSTVKVESNGASHSFLSRSLTTELVSELAGYPWLTVVHSTSDEARPAATPPAGQRQATYRVQLDVTLNGSSYGATTLLQDAETGAVVWRSRRNGEVNVENDIDGLLNMTRVIASGMGQPFGAISKIEMKALGSQSARGDYACLVSMRIYLQDYAPEAWKRFKSCALPGPLPHEEQRAVALGLRAIARLHMARWYGGGDRATLLQAASRDAEAAYRTGSDIQLILSVTMRSRACQGDLRGAQEIADRIFQERFYHATALADASHVEALVLGDEPHALKLAKRAQELSFDRQRWHVVAPALAALRQGDQRAARALLGNVSSSNFPLGLVIGLAVSDPDDDRPVVEQIKQRLMESGFRTADSILGIVDNECWSDAYKKLLRPKVQAALKTLAFAGR